RHGMTPGRSPGAPGTGAQRTEPRISTTRLASISRQISASLNGSNARVLLTRRTNDWLGHPTGPSRHHTESTALMRFSALFSYSKRHDAATVDKWLGTYRGYLVADAHSVFDHLYKQDRIVEVAFADTPRYFFKNPVRS